MYTYSSEHLEYLKKIKQRKKLICFWQILIFSLFLITWELLAKNSIINAFIYSYPSKIISTLISLFNHGNLSYHICITLFEIFISFLLSSIIGILVASLMWKSDMVAKVIDPYLTIINSLPKVALGPLIIIWIGASIKSIIFMALTISVFTTIINIYNSFSQVNNNYIVMMKSFRATKWQIYKLLIIPINFINIISTLKVNISLCLIGVIMGELLVSKAGLGYLIMYGSQVFNLDLVISSVFILGIISYTMYILVDFIHKKVSTNN